MNNKFKVGDIVYVEDNYIDSYIGVVMFIAPYYNSYQYQISRAISKVNLSQSFSLAQESYIRLATDEDFKILKDY